MAQPNKKHLSGAWQFVMMNTSMAVILSVIISMGMTWMQMGFGDGYWQAVGTAIWQSFIIALPAAHLVSYFVQKVLDHFFIFDKK